MTGLLAFIVPVVFGMLLSGWIYGAPWSGHRRLAPTSRTRVAHALAAFVALLATTLFFTRTFWFTLMAPQMVATIFLGLIWLLINVAYAAVLPQKDL
jgi:hypothetical protein